MAVDNINDVRRNAELSEDAFKLRAAVRLQVEEILSDLFAIDLAIGVSHFIGRALKSGNVDDIGVLLHDPAVTVGN